MSLAANICVRAVVFENLKQPVSVEMPVYKQFAIAGVIPTPSSSASGQSISAHAAAVESTQNSFAYSVFEPW